MRKSLLIALFCVCFFTVKSQTAPLYIKASEASKHLNETVTILDMIYGSRDLDSLIVVDFGGIFPKQPLTLVIVKRDSPNKFVRLLKNNINKRIWVTGKLIDFKGETRLMIYDSIQISLMPKMKYIGDNR